MAESLWSRFTGRWSRRTTRIAVVFGFVWIIGIVGSLLLLTSAPIAMKLAFSEYGLIGLASLAAAWYGKDRDPRWVRTLKPVQWAGFALGAVLLWISTGQR